MSASSRPNSHRDPGDIGTDLLSAVFGASCLSAFFDSGLTVQCPSLLISLSFRRIGASVRETDTCSELNG